MPGLTDVKAALDAEKADLATMSTQLTSLLEAFAAGTFTPADAQALLDEITSNDATVKSSVDSINAALQPPPPAA